MNVVNVVNVFPGRFAILRVEGVNIMCPNNRSSQGCSQEKSAWLRGKVNVVNIVNVFSTPTRERYRNYTYRGAGKNVHNVHMFTGGRSDDRRRLWQLMAYPSLC